MSRLKDRTLGWEATASAAKGVARSNPDGLSANLIQTQLERILASSAFDASLRSRAFLRFIVEETLAGRGDRIKGYTIGTSVLQRDAAFDPQTDPIVRIEASRLRRSLERYHLIAGHADQVRIDVPKWGYVPSFQRLQPPGEDGAAAPEPPEEEPPVHAAQRAARRTAAETLGLPMSRRILARGAWAALPLGMVAIVLATALWVWDAATKPETVVAEVPSRGPSIIVLPFENLSGEPAKAYLAGGVREEILTGLAQFKELFVYGRETAASYGAAVNYDELHRELGVRYVLQGSVREAGGRIRVTAGLVDAATGVQLWASAYEAVGNGADLFRLQSDIARSVAVQIGQPYGVVATEEVQLLRGKAPESLSAYECVLQVLDYYRHMSPARVEAAQGCLERVTEREPDYADAWALLGMSYLDQIRLRMAPRSRDQDLLDQALRAAQKSAEVAPDSALAHRSLLLVHSFRGEVEQAVASGERAVALGPNNPEVLAEFGMRVAFMGQWERGIALIDEAMARNPEHPGWYHTAPALNFYRQGRYAEALQEAKQFVAPDWLHNHTILAMIYGQLGQKEQAWATVRRILQMDPDFEKNAWYEVQLRNFPESMVGQMIDGLRKAGLRIPAQPPRKSDRST
jgi:TolB-like protein/Tfp pilus assembly protein PilF